MPSRTAPRKGPRLRVQGGLSPCREKFLAREDRLGLLAAPVPRLLPLVLSLLRVLVGVLALVLSPVPVLLLLLLPLHPTSN